MEATLERWFTPEFRAASPSAVAAVREMLLGTSPQGYAGCCAAIRNMDLRVPAPRIASPTPIKSGARDPSPPAGERRRYRLNPRLVEPPPNPREQE